MGGEMIPRERHGEGSVMLDISLRNVNFVWFSYHFSFLGREANIVKLSFTVYGCTEKK